MKRKSFAVAFMAVTCASVSPAGAQPSRTVDFQRDVQPILRDNCYGCHGPEQRMNGFRIDRRSDAFRGGTQTVIGPGNAEGSKLYHRLIDPSAGNRMPPTGSLSADQIRIIKTWIDEGADWPDAVSGEREAPPVDAGADRLAALIRAGDEDGVERLLRSRPASAAAHAARGATPLMFAALYGDAALVQRLLALGADVNASDVAGATALMWAIADRARVKVLLDAGADVNAISDDRRTALAIAAGTVGSEPVVRLLLEYGAMATPERSSDPSALREAVRAGNVDAFKLLLDYGGDLRSLPAPLLRTACFRCAEVAGVSAGGPLALNPPPDRGLRPTLPPVAVSPVVKLDRVDSGALRAAVTRAMPVLQRLGPPFIRKTGCVSCHHNSLVSMAVTTAKEHGFPVDGDLADLQRRLTASYLEEWRARTLQNNTLAGAQDTVGYVLFGLAFDRHTPDLATDAQVVWLLRRQEEGGRWPLATLRPPIESNDVAVTALAMRAVDLFAPKPFRAAADAAVERGRRWLTTAAARTTEERAFRVLGLVWGRASVQDVRAAAAELVALQTADGGWAQNESMPPDAYATGEALVALQASGESARHDAAARRGLEFLARTQLTDGSWPVTSRSVPIQVYFESGFPHGADQWLSAAATAWAVTALAGASGN